MTIALAGTPREAQGSSNGNGTQTFAEAVAAGDALGVFITCSDEGTIVSVSDSVNGSWGSPIVSVDNTTDGQRLQGFAKLNSGAASAGTMVLTVTFSGNAVFSGSCMFKITGAATSGTVTGTGQGPQNASGTDGITSGTVAPSTSGGAAAWLGVGAGMATGTFPGNNPTKGSAFDDNGSFWAFGTGGGTGFYLRLESVRTTSSSAQAALFTRDADANHTSAVMWFPEASAGSEGTGSGGSTSAAQATSATGAATSTGKGATAQAAQATSGKGASVATGKGGSTAGAQFTTGAGSPVDVATGSGGSVAPAQVTSGSVTVTATGFGATSQAAQSTAGKGASTSTGKGGSAAAAQLTSAGGAALAAGKGGSSAAAQFSAAFGSGLGLAVGSGGSSAPAQATGGKGAVTGAATGNGSAAAAQATAGKGASVSSGSGGSVPAAQSTAAAGKAVATGKGGSSAAAQFTSGYNDGITPPAAGGNGMFARRRLPPREV